MATKTLMVRVIPLFVASHLACAGQEFTNFFFPVLVYPTGTVYQLVAGVSAPIPVPNKTVSISWGYQLNFLEPWNATQFHQLHKREAVRSLEQIYLPIQGLLQDRGFHGQECLLRSICEASQVSFSHEESGFLEEIAHSLLTPSEEYDDRDSICDRASENIYLGAECSGKKGEDCFSLFDKCSESPLDFISDIFV
ncbi:hypothetical protein C0J52_05215 [Blattella germanica]|nr:hypothetical protein C0J52_05215 [Blattella germanica]